MAYRRLPPHIRSARTLYIYMMAITLLLSCNTYALDMANFYVVFLNEWKEGSAEMSIWLATFHYLSIGGTHLAADGLLVCSLLCLFRSIDLGLG